MKNLIFLSFCLILNYTGFSQIHFEVGYFINNSNERIECLIKNKDWKHNPIEFNYKLSERSEILIGNIQSIKEFGVSNTFKYVKAKVKIDVSVVTDRTNYMSKNKDPEYVEKEIFLKSLLEGDASLYEYKDISIKKYFFKKNTGQFKQLLYKVYFDEKNNRIRKNDLYKHQLGTDLKCKSIDFKYLGEIKYTRKHLLAVFKNITIVLVQKLKTFQRNKIKLKQT